MVMMTLKLILHVLGIGVLASVCLTALGEFLQIAETRGLDRALTWVLSSELSAPVLLGGAALLFGLHRKSNTRWRKLP
jgi:hypothetical protein